MPPEPTPKEIAKDFLVRCAGGDVDEAYRRYVADDFRHHNVQFAGDRESLRQAMRANAEAMPSKSIDVRHALEDGPMVATLSEVRMPGVRVVVAHLFRFAGGRIVELWDVGQPVPADSPNANGPL